MNNEQLTRAVDVARAENPKLRIRDLARELGSSEAQLVALGAGSTAIRLRPEFREILLDVCRLGTVMALTRNDNAVHERHGVYGNISFDGPVGLVVNPDIDLRLFLTHWAFGFAVSEGERRSLQFFDRSGEAVHKIYLTDASDAGAYKDLVEKYRSADADAALPTKAYPAPAADVPDELVDAAGFAAAWAAMTDSHEFFPILRRFGLSRLQAMRLAPAGYVRELPPDATRSLLEAAAAQQVPVMIFVANRGCIQIHTGLIGRLLATGPWFNVLDPLFNLHLRQDGVASVFLVRKPGNDGDVHSVEAYDAAGNLIIQCFGSRKPGVAELPSWRRLVSELPSAGVAAAR